MLLIKKQIDEWVEMQPNLIITLDAPSGVGKTTVAKELGARFVFEIIHMDKFLFPSKERIDLLSKVRTTEDLLNVYEKKWFDEVKVMKTISDASSRNKIVIIEGLFPLNYVDRSKCKSIRLSPSKEVLIELRRRKFTSFYKDNEKKRPRVNLLYKACDFAYNTYTQKHVADFILKLS